jgi:DNA adenine methylase
MSVVQIENLPFQKVLEKYDSETTLFYCDPPYLHETRTGKSEYKHEMSEDDHEELVALLLQIKGMCVLSGYDNELYTLLEDNGWGTFEFKQELKSAGNTRLTGLQGKNAMAEKQRTEKLWIKKGCL